MPKAHSLSYTSANQEHRPAPIVLIQNHPLPSYLCDQGDVGLAVIAFCTFAEPMPPSAAPSSIPHSFASRSGSIMKRMVPLFPRSAIFCSCTLMGVSTWLRPCPFASRFRSRLSSMRAFRYAVPSYFGPTVVCALWLV